MPVVAEDKKTGFKAHQIFETAEPITVAEMDAPNVTVDQMKKFFSVFEKEYNLVNDRAKMERLEDDNGYKILHYIIVTPRLVTNRIMFPCLYEIDGENGEYTFISSTRGQEAWNEKHKDLIGKLVISE